MPAIRYLRGKARLAKQGKGRRFMSPALDARLRAFADPASLPFSALDAEIDSGLETEEQAVIVREAWIAE
jgi:hypothetical protein